MKVFFVSVLLASIFACNHTVSSAQNGGKDADVEVFDKNKEYPLRSHHHNIRSLEMFKKFQTFNEKKMRGEGIAKNEPFVYVDNQDSIIFVRISSDPDIVLCYHHEGDYWVNEIYSHMGNRWVPVLKNGYSANKTVSATRFIRYIQGDSIIEYCTTYIDEFIQNRILVKKENAIMNITIEDDSNRILSFEAIKTIINKAVDMNKFPKNGNNVKLPKVRCYKYDYVVDNGEFIILNRSMNEYSRCKETSLGVFGTQPGLEKFIKCYYETDKDFIDYIRKKYF